MFIGARCEYDAVELTCSSQTATITISDNKLATLLRSKRYVIF